MGKTILRSPIFTAVLFVVAAVLLVGGTVGAVQAAPRTQSNDFNAQVQLSSVDTAVVENGDVVEGDNKLLSGLKSAWGGVTDFVGGIADWIASHKGPIEYDRRLLVPHGRAIMAGLGEGLEKAFGSDVVPLVSGLGSRLADAMAAGSPGHAWAMSRAGSPYPAPARTTVVNQSFNTKVVRSDQDMYAAATILSRSAMRTAMEVS